MRLPIGTVVASVPGVTETISITGADLASYFAPIQGRYGDAWTDTIPLARGLECDTTPEGALLWIVMWCYKQPFM